MLKKMTPLIILALFGIGMYFMLQGMDNAVEIAKGKHPLIHKP